jgi:hypothetical protein
MMYIAFLFEGDKKWRRRRENTLSIEYTLLEIE